MKRPRLKKWAKWACTLAACAAVAVAAGSAFYIGGYESSPDWPGLRRHVRVGCGLIWIDQYDEAGSLMSEPSLGWWIAPAEHWFWGRSGERGLGGYSGDWHAGASYVSQPAYVCVGLSVLYPVALTLVPAALLWYADRRRRAPGLCASCGYDRAGLAQAAKCPECATVPAPAPK